MRMALALLMAVLLSLTAPAVADAEARLHGIPAELRAGDRVEIRWSGLDEDVHEVELELSIGDARWVRISPEMEALEGRFTWHVPSGLAGPARIRLRAGGGRGEREVAARSLFLVPGVAAGPGSSLATPGWWDLGREAGPAPAGFFGSRAPGLSRGVVSAEAVTVPVTDAARGASSERAAARRGEAPSEPHASSGGFRAPRQVPLRN